MESAREIKWLIINKENVIVNKSEYNRLYPRRFMMKGPSKERTVKDRII